MLKRMTILLVLFAGVLVADFVFADPGKPNFTPSIYADGVAWGTKVTTTLPAPNDHNLQSYDIFYVIVADSPDDLDPMQLPVSDAGPRNRNYNGGRWFTHTATWTEAGYLAHGTPLPLLKSYEDIMFHVELGHIEITPGSPVGGPPAYFSCPLLPVKSWE